MLIWMIYLTSRKFLKSTSLSAVTESSYITGKDIACFVPALEHLLIPIKLKWILQVL